MAIKVGGTTVVDDSRNICNVGTVNATSFSGSGANLTGVTVGGVTSVTGTAPVSSTCGTTPVLSMAAATAGVNGYMTSTYASKLDGIAAGATNVTNNNQLSNGAGYITSAPAPSAADGESMALITCVCSTGAATIEITGFSDTYNTYMLTASNVTMLYCSYGMSLAMRWYVCGTYACVTQYDYGNSVMAIGGNCYNGYGNSTPYGYFLNCALGCTLYHPAAASYMMFGFRCATSNKSMVGHTSPAGGGQPTFTVTSYSANNNGTGRSGTVTAICFDSCSYCSCPIIGLFKLYGIK